MIERTLFGLISVMIMYALLQLDGLCPLSSTCPSLMSTTTGLAILVLLLLRFESDLFFHRMQNYPLKRI